MPWKDTRPVDQRLKFIEARLSGSEPGVLALGPAAEPGIVVGSGSFELAALAKGTPEKLGCLVVCLALVGFAQDDDGFLHLSIVEQ